MTQICVVDCCPKLLVDPFQPLESYEWESTEMVSLDHHLSILPVSYPSVQGRLSEHWAFWLNELETSSFVQSIITQGYQLPFLRLPDPVCLLNHRSALGNVLFVTTAIEELVAGHCVVESSAQPIVSSPLSVVFNARGKPRLVVDLRYINQFLPDWNSNTRD